MVKQQLEDDLKRVIDALGYQPTDIVVSISDDPKFGDYTTNIALQLSKQKVGDNKQSAAEVAKAILGNLGDLSYLEKSEVAGPGFLNFFIKPESLARDVEEILKEGNNFGRSDLGKNQKVQVEFVSANPTGPLTLANGRGGTIGDTLANVLVISGYKVDREYYVNDTGNQIKVLGDSVLAAAGKIERKGEHYQGEYVKELAEKFQDQLDLPAQELGHKLADYLLRVEIKPAIERLGVSFDEFYSERSVYERQLIDKTIGLLAEKDLTYEEDGAVWFKSTRFGDEKDRVLVTSESGRGRVDPTYFMADIAHHLDVLQRGYLKRINVLGADHHGYAVRIKSAVEAAGFPGKVDIIFMQMVKLFRGGQEVRMSKRAGNFVTLDELLETVGKDVARFFFLMYAPDSHIDFNLDLAKERSNKNPVYYVQYAHARMNNILAKAETSGEQDINFGLLVHLTENSLIRHLADFPEQVIEVGKSYQIQKLPFYTIQLADLFHRFYENCRVLNAESDELRVARLALVRASKLVLANALGLMGVTAPERM